MGTILNRNYLLDTQTGFGMRNPPTPLSPREQDALDYLEESHGFEDPFSYKTALEELASADYQTDEAQRVIEQLLLKGYLYEVNDQLRVTD